MPEVWPLRAARQQIWEEGGIFRDKSAMSRRRDRQPGSSVGFPLIGPQATVSLEELASFPRLLRGFAQIPPPGAVYDTEILRPNHPHRRPSRAAIIAGGRVDCRSAFSPRFENPAVRPKSIERWRASATVGFHRRPRSFETNSPNYPGCLHGRRSCVGLRSGAS